MCRSNHEDMSDMNVIVDAVNDNMIIFEGDEWLDYDISSGSVQLLTYIHDNFMNEHERYLLRCHKNSTNPREQQDIEQQIAKYYRIVAAFDLSPYCYGKTDNEIYDTGSRTNTCEDRFYKVFVNTRDKMLESEKRAWCKAIVNVIKSNSKTTTMALNNKLFELSQNDNDDLKRVLGI